MISNNKLYQNKQKTSSVTEAQNKIQQKDEKKKEKLVLEIKELEDAKFHHGRSFKTTPNWIVVHYTAMAGTSAKSCTKNFASTSREVSTHFFCDSKEIYRVVDEKHVAWHCGGGQVQQPIKDKKLTNEQFLDYGDKNNWRFKLAAENHIKWKNSGLDFIGNYDSFSVDICCIKEDKKTNSVKDQDWDFNPKAIENSAKIVAYLCYKYNIDLEYVIRHCDATGKPCPRPFVSLSGDKDKTKNDNRWLEFKNKVKEILEKYEF